MKGIEVWYLIAPILAKDLPLAKSDEAREAYVTAYMALKKYDEKPQEVQDGERSNDKSKSRS